ncbi:MAG: hypothetical protein BWY76_02213 [bacterium ADurb.Bin429]|nr:MAG: hypothetical protein BWY76_02213 [bacterium ADurb.Bin429]
MRCPTCETELAPDGACPRCASARTLVPPTPVLATGVVLESGDEHPLDLPYSMTEIRQACEYRMLLGQLVPSAIGGIVSGIYIIIFSLVLFRLVPTGWNFVFLGFLLLGVLLIGRSLVGLLMPTPTSMLIEAITSMAIGVLLVPAAAVFFLGFTPLGMRGVVPIFYAALPILFGYLRLQQYRRFAHLIGARPAKAVARQIQDWLKTLRRAKVKTDETVIHFQAGGTVSSHSRAGLWRVLAIGGYLLLAAVNGAFTTFSTEIHFLHRRDFAIRDGGPAYFGLLGKWRKAVFELGAKWTVKGIISEDCYARYLRWRDTDAGISEPPASVG